MTSKARLGLDVGDRTIGIAASDELGLTAQPVTTIRRTTLKKDLSELKRIFSEYDAVGFVVGLPKNMDGSEGIRAEITRKFALELEKFIPDVPIIFQDERLSTVAAERSLINADVSRKKRKKVIDKMAAVFILQGWLDRQNQKDF